MAENRERELCWKPVPGIPEMPCGDLCLDSEQMGHLRLRLRYREADLMLCFTDMRAVRIYWDGDVVPNHGERSRRSGGLLLVENSSWLGSGDFLSDYGPGGWGVVYQHFRIVTEARHIDVIACAVRSAEWLNADSAE